MKFLNCLIFLFIFSCGHVALSTPMTEKIQISPGHIRFVSIKVPQSEKVVKPKLICAGKSIYLKKVKNELIGYWAQSYFDIPGKHMCLLKDGNKVLRENLAELNVVPYDYPKESLNVDKKRVHLSKKSLKRVTREQEMLSKIYYNTHDDFYFQKPFISPLDYSKNKHKLTSHYGKRRIFNKSHKTQHLGNDFRAKVGSKIPSSNKGKVVLAQDLFYSGKTVIIDHGMGLFSMYGHLDKILVVKGQFVVQGQVLGKSGMTGRVTGPHLHWGVKAHGSWIDGLVLVKESQKHFLN